MNQENNNTENPYLGMSPYPVSPDFTEETLVEIGNLEAEELAPGIVVIKNAFKIDQSKILDHIDSQAEEAHRTRWQFITAEDGVEYGINEDGFRYRLEDVPAAPVRLLQPVNSQTPENVKDFFIYLEEQIYKSLIKYIDFYPLMIGSIWWKNRGHILRYGDGGILGCHADNDTNYKVSQGVRYMPKGVVASRQTCGALVYLNDQVETEEELDGKNFTGGNLNFVHLGISYAPKRGDIIFFPTNYVAAHEVSKMGDGVRYAYLTFFGQGDSDIESNIVIVEPEESYDWCPAVWFNNIYDDYERYCKTPHSRYSNLEKYGVSPGWNPVYQGRNVAQYNKSHEAIVVDKKETQEPDADLPEGPCGTEPRLV
jgi:hypothetical protein